MTDDRDDLAERVAALEDAVREMRDDHRPPTGPLGVPRPPTPREARRFADEYAIPAAIAVLEANVRALELLQAGLDASRRADDAGDRADAVSRSALERADRAVDRLLAEVEDGSLPTNADARSIVEEARRLRDEIDDRLADADEDRADIREGTDGTGEAATTEDATDDETTEASADDDGVEIDVEGELASIRAELDRDAAEGDAATDDDPGDADTNG